MNAQKAERFQEVERFLLEVPKFSSKNPLEETKKFYAFVQKDVEEAQLGKIIHVAGTNGKGSVCAFLQQIFLESGYRVGMFTSPHLVTIRERFMIDGEMISEALFVEAFNRLEAWLDAYRAVKTDYIPTYFERLFFMGLYLFAKAGVEVTVLETGLGGRLDATNVIEKPMLCVITEIGLDHMEYLGDTIAQIAREKAGIIKPNVPVVFLERKREAFDVFCKKASEYGTKFDVVSENDYKINEIKKKYIDFSVASRYDDYGSLILHTAALYQVENAALAIRACEILMGTCGFHGLNIKAGIEKMHWAGRMEEVQPGIYIDGAHNEDGIEAFVETLRRSVSLERCRLIFSVVRDKQYDKMIEKLCTLDMVTEFVITHIPNERGAALDELAEIFKVHTKKKICVYETIEDALLYCVKQRESEAVDIYIVGSLYLAGAVRSVLEKNGGFR